MVACNIQTRYLSLNFISYVTHSPSVNYTSYALIVDRYLNDNIHKIIKERHGYQVNSNNRLIE